MHVFRHVVIFMLFVYRRCSYVQWLPFMYYWYVSCVLVYDAVKLLFTFNCSYVASVHWFDGGGGGAAADSSVYSYGKEV